MLPLRYYFCPALLTVLVFSVPASACERVARTDYERAYCQIQAAGEGRGLPRFEDFRRNDPQVQALLLRRPAARAGIELPALAQTGRGTEQPDPGSAVADPARERNAPTAGLPHRQQEPVRAQNSGITTTEPASSREFPQGLSGCRLAGDSIRCGATAYGLLPNRPRSELAAGALEDSNTMGLPPFRGDGQSEGDRLSYTSAVYEQYVRKMLEIGLAGLTLSYTEFHRSFERHREEGVDFAGRMDAMYRLLKEDRRTRPVQARLHNRRPDSVTDCMPLGQDLIVCDNVRTNWVFQREMP